MRTVWSYREEVVGFGKGMGKGRKGEFFGFLLTFCYWREREREGWTGKTRRDGTRRDADFSVCLWFFRWVCIVAGRKIKTQ